MKKRTALFVSLALVLAVSVGATIAWLTDSTQEVVNKFLPSTVDVELTETPREYKMVPGCDIAKDPKVTFKAGSEASWVFVKVEESGGFGEYTFDSYMAYTIAEGWTELDGVAGVYYREVAASDTNQTFQVLENDKVTVKDTVTKAMMDGLTQETYPKLTFTAYAIQKEQTGTVTEAWAKIPK